MFMSLFIKTGRETLKTINVNCREAVITLQPWKGKVVLSVECVILNFSYFSYVNNTTI